MYENLEFDLDLQVNVFGYWGILIISDEDGLQLYVATKIMFCLVQI